MIGSNYVIDAHCHVYPDKIAIKAGEATGRFYGEIPACSGTTEELLRLGREAGIDRFVIQSVATAPKQVRSINEFIAREVALADGKFIGFGTMHPESDDISADFDHLISLGLKGVKLHPDIQHFKLDDYRCLKIYEKCEEAGIPVLLHTGDKRYDMSNPNRLLPILKIYTHLKVIGAHFGGWSLWDEASRELCGIPNLLVDCSSSLQYIDSKTACDIIHRYGADRVLFGTDYPMHAPDKEIELFSRLNLTEKEKTAILSGNACRLLGI